jgi:hypothetical protein
MPGGGSGGVFISYRREDAAPYARLLQHELRARFPEAQVFVDVDSIEPGSDFSEEIRRAVGSCSVLLALIGREWLTLADDEGLRRLDDPNDYVRLEIQTALDRGVRVVPVLVDNAQAPRHQQLPAPLGKLARLHAVELGHSRYQYDADRLLDAVGKALTTPSPPQARLDDRVRDFIASRVVDPKRRELVEDFVARVLKLGNAEVELGTSSKTPDRLNRYLMLRHRGVRQWGAAVYVTPQTARAQFHLAARHAQGACEGPRTTTSVPGRHLSDIAGRC